MSKLSVNSEVSPKCYANPKKFVAMTLSVLALASVTGCASVAAVDAAPDAANPACAQMMVALPDTIGDAQRRPTTSQATSAWGDPSQVVLRCGVEVPTPTSDPCVSVNDVDWVAHEDEKSKIWTLTTYGRTPATEVVLDPKVIPSSTVLASLSDAAAKIPAQKACVSVDKSEEL